MFSDTHFFKHIFTESVSYFAEEMIAISKAATSFPNPSDSNFLTLIYFSVVKMELRFSPGAGNARRKISMGPLRGTNLGVASVMIPRKP